MLFLTFHGPERFRAAAHATDGADPHPADEPTLPLGQPPEEAHGGGAHAPGGDPHESPAVVTVPLVALAIPSVIIGALTAGSVLYGSYFGGALRVLPGNDTLAGLAAEFGGPVRAAFAGFVSPPFWLALAGAVTAWLCFLRRPELADAAARRARWLYTLLTNKYYFDWLNERLIAPLARLIGVGLWKGGDQALIDGVMVDGTAAEVNWLGGVMRRVQSGYLYSYAFWMVIGLAVLLGWFLIHALHG